MQWHPATPVTLSQFSCLRPF